MKRIVVLLSLVVLFTVSCVKSELETQQVSNVSSTPCKQEILRNSGLSNKVNVEFTNKGVQITHYNFEVSCDFTTVNVTYTFINGVLNISQQGSPNQADCVCHTDVSYTIEGILQNEVNVIFINGAQVYCYNDNDISAESCWDYPVKPDMPEWAELKSLNEKVTACQIPDSILSRLSTECLTKVCLQYPLLYDIFAFSSYPAGFDRIFYEFNGIRELFEKEKASVELLKHYNGKILDMSILDNPTTPNLEKGYFIMSISVLEVLLYGYSQKVDAARETYIEILRCLTVGYEKQLEYTDSFKGRGFASNFFARANIIVKINPESIHVIPSEILNGNPLITQDFTGIINELSYQLIQ